MSVYRQLLNTFSLSDVDDISVNGTIDFSDATLVGFPTDNITIRVNEDGQIEVMNGSITIAKIAGTDLETRLLSDESNITTVLSRTQYLTASGDISTFTGTIAVQAITFNGVSLEVRLAAIEAVNTTQDTRITLVEDSINSQETRLTAVEAVNTTQDTRLTAIEAVNVTQSTNITTLQGKTVYVTTGIVGPFTYTYISSNLLPVLDATSFLGDLGKRWAFIYGVIGVLNTLLLDGVDLLPYVESLDTRTQYLTAVSNISTFTGTIAVPAITLNGVSLNTRITNIETDNFNQQITINAQSTLINTLQIDVTALQVKTQYQSASSNITTFTGTIAVPFITLAGVSLNNSLTTLQSRTSRITSGGSGSTVTTYIDSRLTPLQHLVWDIGTTFELWRTLYVQSISLNGTDLNTRISSIETNATTLLNRTQYLTAASNISTFTGTIAVPAITLNGTSLDTRLTTIEGVNTTQNTNITTLQTKTQYLTAASNISTFTGTISVPAVTSSSVAQSSGTLTIGSVTSGFKLALNHGTGASDCIVLPLTVKNKKLALYEGFTNEHQFYGFGVNAGSLRLQTDSTASTFDFFQAVNSTSSNQIAKIGSGSYFNGTLYTTGYAAFGTTNVTTAGLAVSGGPGDVQGDSLVMRLLAPSGNGCKLTFTPYTGVFGQINMRVNGNFEITSNTTAYQIVLNSGGFNILGGSDVYKPTGSTWLNPSDSRIKKKIRRDKLPGLKEINQLSLVSYEFNEDAEDRDEEAHIGFIAEEVEQVFPKACRDTPHKKFGKIKSLDYHELFMALFPAIQELSARVTELEQQLSDEQQAKRRAI